MKTSGGKCDIKKSSKHRRWLDQRTKWDEWKVLCGSDFFPQIKFLLQQWPPSNRMELPRRRKTQIEGWVFCDYFLEYVSIYLLYHDFRLFCQDSRKKEQYEPNICQRCFDVLHSCMCVTSNSIIRVFVHLAMKQEFSELTLSLFVSEHGARALHMSLEKLCGCNQAGLLCWRQARCLGFGT